MTVQEQVTISSQANVSLGGTNELLLNAGNAYIKLSGGNIEIGGPGAAEFKAAIKQLNVGGGADTPSAKMSQGKAAAKIKRESTLCEFAARGADKSGAGMVELGK